MDRSKIQSKALTHPPHPRYGVLTAFKYNLLQILENPRVMTGEILPGTVEQIWAVAMLDPTDDAIIKASNDGGDALKEVWLNNYHPSEMVPVMNWFDDQMLGVDASATKDKPQSGGKKSDQGA